MELVSIVKQNWELTERTLRFLLKDYGSTYKDLLEKSGCPNMNSRIQKTLCKEIYDTLSKLNPGYTNDVFKFRNTERLTREKCKLNLKLPMLSQAIFEKRSPRSYGSKIWNTLSCHIKTSKNLNIFKAIIKCLDDNHCIWTVCKHTTSKQ